MIVTIIRANKDLDNGGRCFTKGMTYKVNGKVTNKASLMEKRTINDLGEHHIIGSWWRDFTILKIEKC